MTNFNLKKKDYFSQDFFQLKLSDHEINAMTFEECRFNDCNLSSACFKKCWFIDCRFENCNLSVAKFDFSRFVDVVFKDCKVIGINWTTVDWPTIALSSPLHFENCMLNDNSFLGLNLSRIVIKNCDAHDVDFRDGVFSDADFTHTDFANSLFNGTDLAGANFTEAFNYNINIMNNKIKNAKFSRFEAIRLLECLDIELID